MPARTTSTHTRARPVSAAASWVLLEPPLAARGAPEPGEGPVTTRVTRGSDRLGVVVLVLIAVITRVVVLVASEVDLVEDDPDLLGMRLDDRLQRALGEPPPRHFRADHEHHA